jgi:hypothetical protein
MEEDGYRRRAWGCVMPDDIVFGWKEALGGLAWLLFFGLVIRAYQYQTAKMEKELEHIEIVKVSRKVRR